MLIAGLTADQQCKIASFAQALKSLLARKRIEQIDFSGSNCIKDKCKLALRLAQDPQRDIYLKDPVGADAIAFVCGFVEKLQQRKLPLDASLSALLLVISPDATLTMFPLFQEAARVGLSAVQEYYCENVVMTTVAPPRAGFI